MNQHTSIDGIHRLQLPTPYPVGPVNCYLLDGPDPVLVDCGPATLEAERALRAALAELGLAPRDLARILLTHHHPDHVGGLRWLRGETEASIAAHPFCDLWLLADPRLVEARQTFFLELYRYCGVEGNLVDELRRRFSDYAFLEATQGVDTALAAGDDIELGGSHWSVLATPGHAGTHLGFLRSDGVFLGGDTLLERISSNALAEPPYPAETERRSSLLAYRATLQQLAALPLSTILPGHGTPFSLAHTLIPRRLQAQEERAQRLLGHLRQMPATVLTLSERLFPGLAPDQLFLGLSEVLGHLDLLESQGLAWHEGEFPALYHARQ